MLNDAKDTSSSTAGREQSSRTSLDSRYLFTIKKDKSSQGTGSSLIWIVIEGKFTFGSESQCRVK